jgi:DNA-binding response OmpR family regulator
VLKVMIAEDDMMIADAAEHILVQHGYDVCGSARTVADAVALIRMHKPDLAVIDMRLADGGLGSEIAAQLGAFGRPGILYATGNTSRTVLSAVHGDACLVKPYSFADLLRGLEIVAAIVATGKASPPFPRGFQLLPAAATASPGTRYG